MKDIAVTGTIVQGPYVGSVCEALWTKPDGSKVCLFTHLSYANSCLECFEFPRHSQYYVVMFVVSMQGKVCLRYETDCEQNFSHEADMANFLRHENVLELYGVVIASSYSPSLALVSFL